jgi:MarR family transcriptional regulator, organic hydroperoxide resistance regulator
MRRTAAGSASDAQVLEMLGLLWEVEHALRSQSKRMEGRLGVTGPQRLVLRLVSRRRDMSPGDLARAIHLHPSTLTGILRRLVNRGLIERRADRHDHRRALLRVLPGATPIVRATRDTVESRVATVLAGLPEGTIGHARQVLGALVQGLSAEPSQSADGSGRRTVTACRAPSPGRPRPSGR